ncbi:hypothetical protein Godav_007105 [Gossypium davidsonii]|uniref:EF-hand domain-containing protein n=1 Tax=Gossypium davidsonii TaxID=34287 RepID=A0A7J8S6P6_GOSDV|nr:hypothetical protein [Gossypium davidsonii]
MNDKQPAKLDEEQMAELRETFPSFDRSNDGSLTQLELGWLLQSLRLNPSSSDQVEALIQKADSNNNGLVKFSEFATMMGMASSKPAELAHSMAKLGNALTMEELTEMIKEADTDGEGRMSLEKFSHAIISAAFEF